MRSAADCRHASERVKQVVQFLGITALLAFASLHANPPEPLHGVVLPQRQVDVEERVPIARAIRDLGPMVKADRYLGAQIRSRHPLRIEPST